MARFGRQNYDYHDGHEAVRDLVYMGHAVARMYALVSGNGGNIVVRARCTSSVLAELAWQPVAGYVSYQRNTLGCSIFSPLTLCSLYVGCCSEKIVHFAQKHAVFVINESVSASEALAFAQILQYQYYYNTVHSDQKHWALHFSRFNSKTRETTPASRACRSFPSFLKAYY